MLKNIYIKNIVLIDEIKIDINFGLNVFTGETGAGKSILLGGLGLALGSRANFSYIRNNKDLAIVTAKFILKDDHPVKEFLITKNMNKKIKYYENLGFIISFIKNEYPAKISKKFSDKVMNTIESNSEKYATFLSLNAITKVASVFVFAIITVYVLQFSENRIEYTGKSIESEYSHPTKNVKNESDDCINERKLSPGEKDTKCK